MPLLQRCSVCKEKKPCYKRKCQSCTSPEDRAAYAAKKNEKKKGYKKIDKTRKPTGEGDFFEILARTRKHWCYITDTPIHGGIKPINCMHVLNKGQYPAWRLNPRNVVFAQSQCHVDEHSQPQSVLEARPGKEGEGWRKYFELKEKFKKEYKEEKLKQ